MRTYLISYDGRISSVFSDPAENNLTVVPYRELVVDPEVAFDPAQIKRQYHLEISPEGIHLFFNHRAIWKEFLTTSFDYCLIVEDQVRVDESPGAIARFIESLPNGWQVFFPVGNSNYDDSQGNKLITARYPGSTVVLEWYWNRSIYFVSRAGAYQLLQISTIAGLPETTAVKNGRDKFITVCFYPTNWFKLTEGALNEKNERIKHTILNFNAWDGKAKALIRALLKAVSQTAERLNIDLILHGGSLLGYVRHGGIIPWDDDIDLGIEENSTGRFLAAVSSIPGVRTARCFEGRTGVFYYKIWSIDGEPIINHGHRFPFIDVWLYRTDGQDILFHNGFVFPNAATKAFAEINFEGAAYKIPHNSIECLDNMYKDWKQSIRIYPYSHKFETIANYPLEMKIQVDSFGRII